MAMFVSSQVRMVEEISVMAFLSSAAAPPDPLRSFCAISDTKLLWPVSRASQYFLAVPLLLFSHPEIVFLNNAVMFPLPCLSGTVPATKALPLSRGSDRRSTPSPLMLSAAASSHLCARLF